MKSPSQNQFYSHIDKSLRIIFMIGNSIDNLEFENLETQSRVLG